MYFSVLTVILVRQLDLSRSCQSGGYYYYYGGGHGGSHGGEGEGENNTSSSESLTTTVSPINDSRSKYNSFSEISGGFKVPESELEKWRLWLKTYKRDRKNQLLNDMKNENAAAYDKMRGPGNGWPESWANLGAGHAGFPPGEIPPWGYKHSYAGLPALCYSPPERGQCEDKSIVPSMRWGFNIYTETCEKFDYSGCGGNANNFKEELKCTESCLQLVPDGCELETDLPIDEYTLRRRLTRKCA